MAFSRYLEYLQQKIKLYRLYEMCHLFGCFDRVLKRTLLRDDLEVRRVTIDFTASALPNKVELCELSLSWYIS